MTYSHHFGAKKNTFNSSINRSLLGAITLMNCGMNGPKNQLAFGIEIKKERITSPNSVHSQYNFCPLDVHMPSQSIFVMT